VLLWDAERSARRATNRKKIMPYRNLESKGLKPLAGGSELKKRQGSHLGESQIPSLFIHFRGYQL